MTSRDIYGFDDDISRVEEAEREADQQDPSLKHEIENEIENEIVDEEGIDLDTFIRNARLEREGITEIKFTLWNATGLQNNIDSLVKHLRVTETPIAFVTETWFTARQKIPDVCTGRVAICTNVPEGRSRGCNGIAVVLNPYMDHGDHVKNMQVLHRDTIDGCWMLILLGTTKILIVYNPPSASEGLDFWLDGIAETCGLVPDDQLLVVGDFNARHTDWHDTFTNPCGVQLLAWMETWQAQRVDTGRAPTFSNSHGASIVDHVLCSAFQRATAVVGRSFSSFGGHRPIHGTIGIRRCVYAAIKPHMRFRTERLKDPAVEIQFRERMDAIMEEFATSLVGMEELPQTRIDRIDKELCLKIKSVAKDVFGVVASCKFKNYAPLTSDHLTFLESQQAAEPGRNLNKEIAAEMGKIRRERFNAFTMDMDQKAAGETIKVVSQIKRNRGRQTFALSNSDEGLDRAADYFERMSTNSLPPGALPPTNRTAGTSSQSENATMIFTRDRYVQLVAEASLTTAPGNSKISNAMIKEGGARLMQVILDLFKIYYVSGRVPTSWTRALICPVPKKGDLNKIENYRPISLTETLRKLFEKFLARHMIQTMAPMHASQGGFRADHCCNDMILCLDTTIKSSTTDLHMAFLDIKAAYDSVDRSILWRRCINAGMDRWTLKVIKGLFDRNRAQVVIGRKTSRTFKLKSGVLQGSVLSPLLYSIFINSLPEALEAGPRVIVGSAAVNCILYADDLVLVAKTATHLKLLLKMCESHARRNRYAYNVSKCAVIGPDDAVFTIDAQRIRRAESFVYLGVDIDRKGIDASKFVARRIKDTKTTAENVRMMGMNIGGFSIRSSANIYKSFLRSKLEASMCILPPLATILTQLEQTQQFIISRIAHTSRNTSATILKSIFQVPRMAWRLKWLRSSFWYRFQALPDTHLLKLMQPTTVKMTKNIFPADLEARMVLRTLPAQEQRSLVKKCKKRWQASEMQQIGADTKAATSGHLDLVAERSCFLRTFAHPMDRKVIVHWVLKKYPAREPPKCANCLFGRATQSHIAQCTKLLEHIAPHIPARWRVEHLVSLKLTATMLCYIADDLKEAINKCLAYMQH